MNGISLWLRLSGLGPNRGASSVLSLEISYTEERGPHIWAGDTVWTTRGSVAHILSGCSQQDAQEFLKLLMERLHLEINRRGRRAPPILASGPVPSPPRRGGALHEEPELR